MSEWLNSANKDTERVDGNQIYCRSCGAEKLKSTEIAGKTRVFKVECECDKARREEEAAKAKDEARFARNLALKLNSGLGKRYANAIFSNTGKNQYPEFNRAMNDCIRYCAESEDALRDGKGLYLWGESGIGKTWLAACICNELTDLGYTVKFTSFCEISRRIRETFNTNRSENEIFKELISADFLIIDDIGTEIVQRNNNDNWLQERIYDIINSRYIEQKPMIYTSNYSITSLVTDRNLMQKTADRIFETSNAVIAVKNKNWRYVSAERGV